MVPEKEQKFDFNDVLIQPALLSTIKSRSEINPFDKNGFLPLFTAPMTSVVDARNYRVFYDHKINVTLPRTLVHDNNAKDVAAGYVVPFDVPVYSSNTRFISVSLKQFEAGFVESKKFDGGQTTYILIDVANGHMSHILDLAAKAKARMPKLVIMAGNIASPDTYHEYAKSGVIDYARVGIGNGNGCLTTEQTGVGYPMASLIHECKLIKNHFNFNTAIVADGGMKKYADIIKAIALGADYVMVGSIFSKALESASPIYWKGIKMPRNLGAWMYEKGYDLKKEFYGMSTKKAQQLMGNKVLKTSEGVTRTYNVEYTLEQWVTNFEHYYRSAMSYSGARNKEEFHNLVRFNIVTQNAYIRYNK